MSKSVCLKSGQRRDIQPWGAEAETEEPQISNRQWLWCYLTFGIDRYDYGNNFSSNNLIFHELPIWCGSRGMGLWFFYRWCLCSMKNMERILWTCLMECSLSCYWTRVTTASLLLEMRLGLLPFTLAGDLMVTEMILNPVGSSLCFNLIIHRYVL